MRVDTYSKRPRVVSVAIFYFAYFCTSSWAAFNNQQDEQALRLLHVHIPKTGGYSIYKDARRIATRHEGISFQSPAEVSYLAVRKVAKDLLADPASAVTSVSVVTTLRNPFTHLLSQFIHCKYFRTKGARHDLFNKGRDPSNILDGFEAWINFHLSAMNTAGTGEKCRQQLHDQFCYNPANMQTRYLAPSQCILHAEITKIERHSTANAAAAHHAYGRRELLPDLADATRNLGNIDIPGIMELYPQTVCLMEALTPEGMPASCVCGSEPLTGTHIEHHESHGLPPHSLDMVPAHIIPKMYKLVEEDVELYMRALSHFEAKVSEVEAKTGQRLLCGNEVSRARDAVLQHVVGPSQANPGSTAQYPGLEL